MDETRVIGMCVLLALGFAAWLVLFFEDRNVISDQQEVDRRRREWRGDFGLEQRQRQVAYVRTNWAAHLLFGAGACAVAALAFFARYFF